MQDYPFPKVAARRNVYRGERHEWGCTVTCNGNALDPRYDLRNHSDNFEWGYGGSGPSQLALAILANEYGETIALYWFEDFKWHVVASLPKDRWLLTSEQIYYKLVFTRNERERVKKEAPF